MKICLVIQRYGEQVNGGAEAYAREVAEHLASIGGHEVHAATTKAIDYVTWKNEYEADEEVLNNVTIHRFPTVRERDSESFNKLCGKVLTEPTSIAVQEEWMRLQGPETPALVEWVRQNRDNFDCFIFVCYLYYTTYYAMPLVADKAIFIPTAHEEAPIHLDMFRRMFRLPAAFYYNTVEEKELTERLFGEPIVSRPNNDGKGGVGVELPDNIDAQAFRKAHNLDDDFMLYVGRIDENKCCNVLFEYFDEYKKRNPDSKLKLVLMGKSIISVPSRDDIISLGFVDELEKFSGMAAANFLILPSRFESLSIVVLEAMSLGTPVLLNGNCDVLEGHCVRSNGGLYYKNYFEFEGAVNLLTNPSNGKELASKMGENGKRYVENDYSWKKIVEGYERLCNVIVENQSQASANESK